MFCTYKTKANALSFPLKRKKAGGARSTFFTQFPFVQKADGSKEPSAVRMQLVYASMMLLPVISLGTGRPM